MRFLNALQEAHHHIKTLCIIAALEFVIILALILGWHSSQSKIRILIPPQIPVDGLSIKSNEIPKASVYSFAFYIWQSVNYWPQDGSKDYRENIDKYRAYITPKFHNFLVNDYNNRLDKGEVQARIRTMQGLFGSSYDPKNVKYIGHDTWLVNLVMRLTERMDNNGNPIKDAQIDYVLKVVRYSPNADKNQWGLALDGFAASPKRIKTEV